MRNPRAGSGLARDDGGADSDDDEDDGDVGVVSGGVVFFGRVRQINNAVVGICYDPTKKKWDSPWSADGQENIWARLRGRRKILNGGV